MDGIFVFTCDFFFFKQKTAYEMRISDWSSDVCSSDLPAEPAPVQPDDDAVTGFVFKVQANMNPAHRDRIAFMRPCSCKFARGMRLMQGGPGEAIRYSRPLLFLAQDRALPAAALPGDVSGIPTHGTSRCRGPPSDAP